MKKLFKVALIGVLGTFLPMVASAQDVMTIVGGKVGVLTATPVAPLDVNIGAAAAGPGNSVLRLEKIGDLGFQLKNTNDPAFWQFSNAASGAEFRISKSGTGATEFKLTPAGNMTITGSLVTGGPTCAGGCDRVFADDYELLSIEQHGKAMFENKHLPAIGPTEPNKPVNISEQYGNMLNELEHAHIYIQQLNGEKNALHQKVDTLETRLSELEALLSR